MFGAMTPAERGALILETIELVRSHCGVFTDDAQQLAQARTIERAADLAEELPVSAAGMIVLRGRAALGFCNVLLDCVARLRRAAEDTPALAPARAVLRAKQNQLIRLRDETLTRSLHAWPARRPEPRRPNGRDWNEPPPEA